MTAPDFLTAPLLTLPGLRHGFLTRRGGVSEGVYGSLNCAVAGEDKREHTNENRRRAAATFDRDVAHLQTLYQVHSNIVATIEKPFAIEERPRADATVTRIPGLMIGILTADCAPVLFHDPVQRVIGAAHSGWAGTLANISEKTIKAMEALGAQRKDIHAVVGPCIAQASYEVGPDFPSPFLAADKTNQRFFVPSVKENHWQYDLRGMIKSQLDTLGVQAAVLPQDTYVDEDNFFSNRRKTHRGEASYGLQLSAISLD